MAAFKRYYLPKPILEMRFMKRTKERLEQMSDDRHHHRGLYSNTITNKMRHGTGNYISESSFIFCEDLIDGRVSYKGMNPEIERLMISENKSNDSESEMLKDVSDEILINKMHNLLSKRKRDSSPGSYRKKK